MTIGVILVALLVAFLAFRFIAGIVKFVVIAAVLIAAAYFVLNGGLGA